MTAETTSLDAYLEEHRERRLAAYLDFLRIPSISGIPDHAPDCRRAAEWLADQMRAAGAENVEVCETGGHPIVYGDRLHADGAPTVVVYGHYDVQPVDPIDEWETAPFEPFVADGRVVGRGAADDKGQVMLHVRALEAALATRGTLPVNVKYVFEGEEESSSVHLDAWLEANRERLAADLAVISDTGFFDGNRPAVTIGLRGVAALEVHVDGAPRDLHSGSFGGVVNNPLNALCEIVAALKGPDGRIRVPGFYDDVVPLADEDRAAFAALPFDEEAYRVATGVPALYGEVGYTTLERRGARPTLDLNGIWGGFQGAGGKTIIPASAHAKITCRLVADQDPDRITDLVRAYIEDVAPPGVSVRVDALGGGRPSLTPIEHPATRAAARAIEKTFGVTPLYIREGGSVPICASFESIVGLPVVLLGFANDDDHAHAPNESMVLANVETGIRTVVAYWDELAATGVEGLRTAG